MELDAQSEKDRRRPIAVSAGQQSREFRDVGSAVLCVAPLFAWMYADGDDLETARHNPFLWHGFDGTEALASSLRCAAGRDRCRPLLVRALEDEPRQLTSVDVALGILKPCASWLYADHADDEAAYENPFRWSCHDSLQDAMAELQSLGDRNVRRPVFVRNCSKENRHASVRLFLDDVEAPSRILGSADAWAQEHVIEIAWKNETFMFEGKAGVLDAGDVKCPYKVADALNAGSLECPSGICVVYSDLREAYYLLCRTDKKKEVDARFGF